METGTSGSINSFSMQERYLNLVHLAISPILLKGCTQQGRNIGTYLWQIMLNFCSLFGEENNVYTCTAYSWTLCPERTMNCIGSECCSAEEESKSTNFAGSLVVVIELEDPLVHGLTQPKPVLGWFIQAHKCFLPEEAEGWSVVLSSCWRILPLPQFVSGAYW